MAVPSPRLSWYRSFYWRIGITFVAFVVVFLIVQGVILRRTPRAGPVRRVPGARAGGGSGGRCGGHVASRAGRGSERSSQGSVSAAGRRPIRMDGVRRYARQDVLEYQRPAARDRPAHGAVGVRPAAPHVRATPSTPIANRPGGRRRAVRGPGDGAGAAAGAAAARHRHSSRSRPAAVTAKHDPPDGGRRGRRHGALLSGEAPAAGAGTRGATAWRGRSQCQSAAEGWRRDRPRGRGVQPYGRGAGDARRRASHLRCAAPADDGRRLT